MKKILDFSAYYPPHIGGAEKYVEELHQNLAKRDCQITVFTSRIPKSAPKKEMKHGVTIIRYPALEIIFNYPLPCFWRKEFWQEWKNLSQNHYDLTISVVRFFISSWMAFLFAKKKKLPLVHIEHCSDYVKNKFLISMLSRIVDMTIGRFVLTHVDKIITPSQSAAKFVNILSGKKSSVIYRGMPFSEIDSISPNIALRQQLKNKKIIAFVGRLIYGKGIIHLLEAARLLQRDDIFLLIIGDGPEKNNLGKYIEKNRLSAQVKFLGNIPFDEVISILKITDIFVNPSYNEGLPTSVLEAGACRRAIIATNVGGTTEILTQNQSGIIVEPHSAKAIANALEKLLDSAELRSRLGESARQAIKQKFNWENTISDYLKEMEILQKNV